MKLKRSPYLAFFVIGLWLAGSLFFQNMRTAQANPPYKVFLPLVSKAPSLPQVISKETSFVFEKPIQYSSSLYMTTYSPTTSFDYGCQAGKHDLAIPGKQDTLIILAYGQPWYEDGKMGTWNYNWTFASTDKIAESAKQFAKGYWACSGEDTQSTIELAIGTNNFAKYRDGVCTGEFCSTKRGYDHGKAWAGMVKNVAEWVAAQGYAGQVTITGANDIELAWNTAAISKAWVQGFDDANQGLYTLYNFGACENCPRRDRPELKPYNNWSIEDVYYVAWGANSVWPIPEIYNTAGLNAMQWAYLSYWGTQNQKPPIIYLGSLTQWQACLQRGGCSGADNTPQQGWQQLYKELNYWPKTAQENIRWMSDICWLSKDCWKDN